MKSSDLKYEIATSNHLTSVISLLEQFKLPVEDVQSQLENFILLKTQDQVIGCAGLEIYSNVALIRSVVIHSDWQGKGLGKRLVEYMINRAHEEGVEQVYLLTETAVNYFEKIGFSSVTREEVDERIKKTREFSVLCPDSAVTMIRHLDATF
jgi:amino-acid N-acetyltransferase